MCERVAPVRMALAEARSGVTVAGHRMAVMAHLASGPVVAPPAADARLWLAACCPLTLLLRGGVSSFVCTGVGSTASASCLKKKKKKNKRRSVQLRVLQCLHCNPEKLLLSCCSWLTQSSWSKRSQILSDALIKFLMHDNIFPMQSSKVSSKRKHDYQKMPTFHHYSELYLKFLQTLKHSQIIKTQHDTPASEVWSPRNGGFLDDAQKMMTHSGVKLMEVYHTVAKSNDPLPPPPSVQYKPNSTGGAWLPPNSTGLRVIILHHAPPSTVQMHAPRSREGESTLRRVKDRMHRNHKKKKNMRLADEGRFIKKNVRSCSMIGGECWAQEKERRHDWRQESGRRREGVSRLTDSPSVLGLPPPSVYRCPAETEGTTELHTPPSPDVPVTRTPANPGT